MNSYRSNKTPEEKALQVAKQLEFAAIRDQHVKPVILATMTPEAVSNMLASIKAVYDANIQGAHYKGNFTAWADAVEKMFWAEYGDKRESGESHIAPAITSAVMTVQPTPAGNIVTESGQAKRKVKKTAPTVEETPAISKPMGNEFNIDSLVAALVPALRPMMEEVAQSTMDNALK